MPGHQSSPQDRECHLAGAGGAGRKDRDLGSPSAVSQRALRARMAAHQLHARVRDAAAHTAPARAAFLSRFEREVDPDGSLDPRERARRAEHARKAYFVRLALASSHARGLRRNGGGGSRSSAAGEA